MYEVTLTKAVRYNNQRYEANDKITVDEETLEQLQQQDACVNVTEVQTKSPRKSRKAAADPETESGE